MRISYELWLYTKITMNQPVSPLGLLVQAFDQDRVNNRIAAIISGNTLRKIPCPASKKEISENTPT